MLALMLLHDVAGTTAEIAARCADGTACLQADDVGWNFLLQTGFRASSVREKADVIRAFHSIRITDALHSVNENDGVWPQPDDPLRLVTDDDVDKMKKCKEYIKMGDPEKYNTSIVCCSALAPPEFNIEHGLHDILFQILKTYQDEQFQWVRQWAWRGLSDNCFTEVGSESIANIGGPNKGVQYMVEQLLVNPPYAGMCEDQVDIQYEILADLHGLLLFDYNNTRAPAAMEAGLVPAIVRSLTIEPDYRPTLTFSCKLMMHLFLRNPEYALSFKNAGVLELVDRSMDVLKQPDDREFHFGVKMSEYFQKEFCLIPQLMMKGDAASRIEAAALLKIYLDGVKAWKPWATIKV